MHSEGEVCAIILARGGSKRLPGKNIRVFAGKPLIGWTIQAAIDSGRIDRIFCSTDDEQIAQIALQQGAEVPFMRPDNLATDQSGSMDSLKHFIKELGDKESYIPDFILLLQPTSPLRRSEHIKEALALFMEKNESGANSLVSVKKLKQYFKYIRYETGGKLKTLKDDMELISRTTFDDYKLLASNGAIYLTSIDVLNIENTFYTENTIPYLMDDQSSIDIDTLEEFELAENIFLARSYNKKSNK